MEFSHGWLSQYLGTPVEPPIAATRLTAAGLAVEAQTSRGEDVVFDIEVTTNRPDCMNHFGIARELAAVSGCSLQAPDLAVVASENSTDGVAEVRVDDAIGCPRYVARVVRGVRVGPSPEWLIERLESIGQRSINNIVDITNFVLWELGQPIHAFDLRRLAQSTVVVRRARQGERLTTLDGEDRRLDREILVIADSERAVALAGIMGGLETEVTGETVDILIESAHFDPTRIRIGSRLLGMHTDASHRFERGADPGICRVAADRVAKLVLEVAGGELLAGAIDLVNSDLDWTLTGTLDLERAQRFGGVELAADRVASWLQGIGFELQETAGVWNVKIPTWRYYDMRADPSAAAGAPQPPVFEADLFEEVLRLNGFDSIPSTLPHVGGPDAGSSAGHRRRQDVRTHLAASGYQEAVTFAFHDQEAESRHAALARAGEPVRLANPLSELYAVMRRSLVPGLLGAARFNLNRGAEAVRLFEIGHVFPGGRSEEIESVAIVAGGSIGAPWDRRTEYDLFDLKGAVESLALRFGAHLQFRNRDLVGFLPGTTAEISTAREPDQVIGYLGQSAAGDTSIPIFAAELRIDALGSADSGALRLPSRFPAVEVDLTLTHAAAVAWSEIAMQIEEDAVDELQRFGLKDRYVGEGVPAGAVNTTIYFLYNAIDRSLTQEEVNDRLEAVRRQLIARFGWKGST